MGGLSNEPSTKVVRHPKLSQTGVQVPKFDDFRINLDKKALKVCHKISLSKNFQR